MSFYAEWTWKYTSRNLGSRRLLTLIKTLDIQFYGGEDASYPSIILSHIGCAMSYECHNRVLFPSEKLLSLIVWTSNAFRHKDVIQSCTGRSEMPLYYLHWRNNTDCHRSVIMQSWFQSVGSVPVSAFSHNNLLFDKFVNKFFNARGSYFQHVGKFADRCWRMICKEVNNDCLLYFGFIRDPFIAIFYRHRFIVTFWEK